MKKNLLITVGALFLLIGMFIYTANNRSAKVVVEESIDNKDSVEYQIPDSILLDYHKVIDNFYKYRCEDSLFVDVSSYWHCLGYMDSLLIFNFDKGTIKKVAKPRCDSMMYYVNYIKGFPTDRTITGDFNGNGKQDTLTVGDIYYYNDSHYDGIDYFYFVFSDKAIPKLKVFGNLDYTIKNEGDLDGDGRDEIGFLYGWYASSCRYYNVYTLKNNKWKRLIKDVFLTHDDMRVMGIIPVEKDPEQEGVILIRSAKKDACCAGTPYVIEKSFKVKK